MDELRQRYDPEQLRQMLNQYKEALRGIYSEDSGTELAGDVLEDVDYDVLEEMLADAYAGINSHAAGANRLGETVRTWLRENHVEQDFFQDNGTEQPTGSLAGRKENTADFGGEKYSAEGEVKDSAQLTEADLMYLLELVETAQLAEDSYIPLRATTPQFLIDVVYEHSKGKVVVKDLPMASKVRHVAQNMEEDDGSSYGDERPHGFDKNDIVTISKEMGHPSYITLQENGRYAEVVSFYNSRGKRVIVAISFADDRNNFKHAHYMNGYNAGYYNIIVTQYEPDNFRSYVDSCEIVYDKQKNERQIPSRIRSCSDLHA